MTNKDIINNLNQQVHQLQNQLNDYIQRSRGEEENRKKIPQQIPPLFGMYTALCVETRDVWKQNRIRFYCPAIHTTETPLESLPWAMPISSMGGFDDCGLNWIPPAGSTVCIIFEAGNRDAAFYLGTTWHRDRGPKGKHVWPINIEEYEKVFEGHRGGYLNGPNNESQVLPQWNTDNVGAFDITSQQDIDENPEAQKRMTYPHIYGLKTPEKHVIKLDDGDPKCNRKNKRIEIMSACGNVLLFKDDHMHFAGQWGHPSCGGDQAGENIECLDDEGEKQEKVECGNTALGGHTSTPKNTKYYKSQKGSNKFFKHQNECRPIKGPGTPQNNTYDLPQSGIQFMSISGHTLVMDDSVEEPSGIPNWERGTKKFDFGCNDKFVGRTYWKSATGHSIEMSDIESPEGDSGKKLRGEFNFIRLLSATGNRIELNDHTVQSSGKTCPPNVGGPKRGITLETTSKHIIEMIDEGNEVCGEIRKEGGKPEARAKKAFIRIRTGYGIEIEMKDTNSQTYTSQQSFQIKCPQKMNRKRGPHILRMQESKSGPGTVFLRAGGDYIVSVADSLVEVVGEKSNPGDKVELISRKKVVFSQDDYINISGKQQIFIAKDRILLMAGQDCEGTNGSGPCIGPVLVYVNGTIRLSDRLYGTASKAATTASIFMMSPLASE